MVSTTRFLREYLRPRRGSIASRETDYVRDGQRLPATLLRPADARAALPAWVVLHGLTYHGRHHASLGRFARALAAGGAAIIVPEVPEWKALEVAPAATASAIVGAVDALLDSGAAVPGRIGVFGFSFGATQGLAALADPRLHGSVRAMAAWGGYYDLHNLFRFGLTGEHELDGIEQRLDPDPYGRWVMGANYLTHVPGYAGAATVTAALRRLAEESGRRGVFAGDACYDPLKAELRQGLPAANRPVFDLFAPILGRTAPDPVLARELPGSLADAALRVDPMLDPAPRLSRVRTPTQVAHGKEDRLVPYTESLRLTHALPAECHARCSITSLFAHSGGAARALHPLRWTREAKRFVQLLHDIFALV